MSNTILKLEQQHSIQTPWAPHKFVWSPETFGNTNHFSRTRDLAHHVDVLGADDFDELSGTKVGHDDPVPWSLGDQALEMDDGLQGCNVPERNE